MLAIRYTCMVSVFCFLAWACSAEPSGSVVANAGASGSEEADASDSGTIAGDGGQSVDGAVIPTEPRHRGFVNVQLMDYPPQSSGSISASFVKSGDQSSCTQTKSGSCTVLDCTGSGSTTVYASAGAMTAGTPSTTLSVPQSGYYSRTDSSSVPYGVGDNLNVHFTGAEVPAFDTTLHLPPRMLVTAPLPADREVTMRVPANQDFRLRWRAFSGALAEVRMTASLGANRSLSFLCSYDGALGSASIPATLMAQMRGARAGLSTMSLQESSKVVGAWDISLASRTMAMKADGAPYSVIVDVEP